MIGDEITVEVREVRETKVVLSIEAPRNVLVVREEAPSREAPTSQDGAALSRLMLTRREGQNIWLGDSIKVGVRSIESGVVKLGVDAPREVRVLRDELFLEQLERAEREEDQDKEI